MRTRRTTEASPRCAVRPNASTWPVAAGLAALIAAAAPSPALAEDGAERCEKLYRLTDSSHAVEPGAMLAATEALPAHCRVRGVVNRAIRFEVTMPVEWNGRMMFTAVGGAAGTIGDTTSLLARGFAQASTDTGHEESEGNAYLAQPEALLDYAYRGVHLATLAAKRIIAHYYERDIDYAYLQGCSNGGRAAMLEAIRFPNDYDGIIAGAPAFRFQEFVPWMLGVYRMQSANPLTADALVTLDNASRMACDLLDGVEDGVIGNPLQCTDEHFDLDALRCAEGETEGCLSAGQIETARYVYADMTDDAGNVLSPGVPVGAEAAGDWRFWMQPNQLFNGASVISSMNEMLALIMRHDPTFDVEEFDPVQDRDRIADAMRPFDVSTADLTEFRDQGGKLLMYQGWNDWPLRPQRALTYLSEMEAEMGGAEATADFFRLFMLPGMAHCAGGPGAWQTDYVAPIVKWREQGEAPDRLVAAQPGPIPFPHLAPDERVAPKTQFTRPLCPHPQFAQYQGSGDQNDAGSFRCVAP